MLHYIIFTVLLATTGMGHRRYTYPSQTGSSRQSSSYKSYNTNTYYTTERASFKPIYSTGGATTKYYKTEGSSYQPYSTVGASVSSPSSGCIAEAGPGKGRPCKFPFKWAGETYYSCAKWTWEGKHYGKYWCSTEVDAFGNHVNKAGNLGFCGFCENSACGCGCNSNLPPTRITTTIVTNNPINTNANVNNNNPVISNVSGRIEESTTEGMPAEAPIADTDDFDIRTLE